MTESKIIEWRAPALTEAEEIRVRRHASAKALAAELRERPNQWALIGEAIGVTQEWHDEHLSVLHVYAVQYRQDTRPYYEEQPPPNTDPRNWVTHTADVYVRYSTALAGLSGNADF